MYLYNRRYHLSKDNTTMLLHCTGVDEATSFPDSSTRDHTVTARGDAQVDTALTDPWGGNTGVLKLDGNNDYLSWPTETADQLKSGDFTIESRCYFNDTDEFRIWQQFGNDDNRTALAYSSTSGLFFIAKEGGSALVFVRTAWTPTINTWYHIVVVRSGSTFKIFVDGVDETTSGGTYAGALPVLTGNTYIGRYSAASTSYTDGYAGEFRISNIARWTSNFTPPTAPYTAD